MRIYNVTVVQHRTMLFEGIEAESEEEARRIAVENADCNPDWDECEPCYEADSADDCGEADEDEE